MGNVIEPSFRRSQWPPKPGLMSLGAAARAIGCSQNTVAKTIVEGHLAIAARIVEDGRLLHFVLESDIAEIIVNLPRVMRAVADEQHEADKIQAPAILAAARPLHLAQ